MLKSERSRREIIFMEVVSFIVRNLHLTYDEAEQKFKNSYTYQNFFDQRSDHKNSRELFYLWLVEEKYEVNAELKSSYQGDYQTINLVKRLKKKE